MVAGCDAASSSSGDDVMPKRYEEGVGEAPAQTCTTSLQNDEDMGGCTHALKYFGKPPVSNNDEPEEELAYVNDSLTCGWLATVKHGKHGKLLDWFTNNDKDFTGKLITSDFDAYHGNTRLMCLESAGWFIENPVGINNVLISNGD